MEHHITKVKERCRVCGRFLVEAREKKTRSSYTCTCQEFAAHLYTVFAVNTGNYIVNTHPPTVVKLYNHCCTTICVLPPCPSWQYTRLKPPGQWMYSLSQSRTSTSAGWVQLRSGVMVLPDSTLTPGRWARWQNSTYTLRRWLWPCSDNITTLFTSSSARAQRT